MTSRRTRLALLAASLSALLLAGCTGPDGMPTLRVEAVTVPEALSATEPWVSPRGSIAPATENRPWAMGGFVRESGGQDSGTVWTSDDGETWSATTVATGVAGGFRGWLDHSDTTLAYAGQEWHEREVTARLWISADAQTWTERILPDSFAHGYSPTSSAVIGDTVLLVGTTASGAAAGIVVDGETVTDMQLPAPRTGELLRPQYLVAGDGVVLLIARPGPAGSTSPTIAYSSTDGGVTWRGELGSLSDASAGVYGVVFTGERFVATGYQRPAGDSGAVTRPAAWSSVDGIVWEQESVPEPPDDSNLFYVEADVWLAAPNANGDRVGAVLANDNASRSAVYLRGADGRWRYIADSTVSPDSGVSGGAVPLSNTALVAVIGNGFARIGVTDASGFRDTQVLAERDHPFWPIDAYPAGDRMLVPLSRSTFVNEEDGGWRGSSESGLLAVSGLESALTDWDPVRVAELVSVNVAAAEDGSEVILGSAFPAGRSAIIPRGYLRTEPGGDWQSLRGFPEDGATNFDAVRNIGGTWYAVGGYRADSRAGAVAHGVMWTSENGLDWTRASGDFGSGNLESRILDVCPLADGSPLAVGWEVTAAGPWSIAVWEPGADGWVRVDLGEYDDAPGWAEGCAGGESGLVISATLGGESVLIRTRDGAGFSEVFRTQPGSEFGVPVAVAGGFAATGWFADELSEGPVVWLSADGASWTPVAVPSSLNVSTRLVAPFGDGLLIGLSPDASTPLLLVRDIAAAIERFAPAG